METGKAELLIAELTHTGVYVMGFSFILGSLFTILILILLDFMRRNKPSDGAAKE
jgi:hypothetical protein